MAKKRTASKAKSQPESVLVYKGCKTLAFISLDRPHEVEIKDTDYSLNLELAVDLANGFVRARITIHCTPASGSEPTENTNDEAVLFSIVTENMFTVTNLKDIAQNEDTTIEMPAWLLTTILSTSVGTTRGVLFTKLAGTSYQSFELPIFSLKDLLPDKKAKAVPMHGI